jgi:hypothetical protein
VDRVTNVDHIDLKTYMRPDPDKSSADEVNSITHELVTIRKNHVEKGGGVVVGYTIESNNDEPVTCTFVDELPAMDVSEIGFHPDYNPQSWSVDEQTIVIEDTIEGEGESQLKLGMIVEDWDTTQFESATLDIRRAHQLNKPQKKQVGGEQSETNSDLLQKAKSTVFGSDEPQNHLVRDNGSHEINTDDQTEPTETPSMTNPKSERDQTPDANDSLNLDDHSEEHESESEQFDLEDPTKQSEEENTGTIDLEDPTKQSDEENTGTIDLEDPTKQSEEENTGTIDLEDPTKQSEEQAENLDVGDSNNDDSGSSGFLPKDDLSAEEDDSVSDEAVTNSVPAEPEADGSHTESSDPTAESTEGLDKSTTEESEKNDPSDRSTLAEDSEMSYKNRESTSEESEIEQSVGEEEGSEEPEVEESTDEMQFVDNNDVDAGSPDGDGQADERSESSEQSEKTSENSTNQSTSDLVAALSSDLRSDEASEEDIEAIRETLGVTERRSEKIKKQHLQSRLDDFAAYADILSEFIDEHGTLTDFAAELRAERAEFRADVENVRDEIEALEDTQSTLRSQVRQMESSFATIQDDIEAVQADVTAVQDDVATVQDDVETGREEIDDEIAGIQHQLDEMTESLEQVEESTNAELAEIRTTIEEFESVHSTLADAFESIGINEES